MRWLEEEEEYRVVALLIEGQRVIFGGQRGPTAQASPASKRKIYYGNINTASCVYDGAAFFVGRGDYD